jgi:translation initiation factor 2B subunit (eIF-2B alpha/beta/delta family)
MSLDDRVAEIATDRSHGAGYLARRALGLLAAAEGDERHHLAELIRTQRPAMPAIAAAVDEALREGDVRAVLRRADAARRRVVAEALRELGAHRRVATISNSSLATRLLVSARPVYTVVAVEDQGDEGWLLLAELRAVGLEAQAAPVDDVDADVAVVGCDAIFDDHGFVNRRGTSRLLARMGAHPAIVLGEPWKVVPGPSPPSWPEPERFEVVAPTGNMTILR